MRSNYRPVLPAPPPSSSPLSSQPAEGSSTNNTTRLASTRQIINAACISCQKRKSKCDGVRPKCSSCVKRLTDCLYETASAEETRTSALKRRNEFLEQELSGLTELYKLLRESGESEAKTVLQLIRSSPDLDTVLRTLREGRLTLQGVEEHPSSHSDPISLPPIATLLSLADRRGSTSPGISDRVEIAESYEPFEAETRSLGQGGKEAMVHPVDESEASSSNVRPLSTPGLPTMDALIPPDDLRRWTAEGNTVFPGIAKRWTRMTSSDALVSHLLSLYYTHNPQLEDSLDQEHALESIRAAQQLFRPGVLANAMLAAACHISPLIPRSDAAWDKESPTYLFLEEARRLWERDQTTSDEAEDD